MIRRAYYNRMTREPVHLDEQGTDDSLDLAGLLDITTFLANSIKLVEEEDARVLRRVVDQPSKSIGGFPQEAIDHRVVANGQ